MTHCLALEVFLSLYYYSTYTQHNSECFLQKNTISVYFTLSCAVPCVCCMLHTQTRYQHRRCGQSILVFTQHMFMPWFFFSSTSNTIHTCVCMRTRCTFLSWYILLSLFTLFVCGLLCFSLSILYAIMCQAPTID